MKSARTISGMVVVITGAAGGIGSALARNLARQGAQLALADLRQDRLDALNAELGGSHLCLQADVSRDADAIIAAILRRFGRIDTLVCNAGYALLRTTAETSADELSRIFAVNLLGTTDCIRAAVPEMLRQELRDGWRGQIMITSSAVARRALPYFGAYSATKAAQLSIAEALRVELRPQHVAVTSVHPIGTNTDLSRAAAELGSARLPRRSSLNLYQSPDTVAKKMARAIRRPRPEVWPFAPAKIALFSAAAFPRITDVVMAKVRRVIRRAQREA